MQLHRITRIKTTEPLILKFEFDDGAEGVHDFREEIERFPESSVIAALADSNVFASATIANFGRAVEWANGYDVCADQCRLWLDESYSDFKQANEALTLV